MFASRPIKPIAMMLTGLALTGCTVSNVSFSGVNRPERAPQLDNYDVFVGKWSWTAEMANADAADAAWSGTAEWNWTLDKRCLEGHLSATSQNATFEANGVWSWHPKKHMYIWTMHNNWGYPQQGTARYDADSATWRMNYKSVGLDGTTSYGRYVMHVIDHDTLEWRVEEWADIFHFVKKMEMNGTYRRQ